MANTDVQQPPVRRTLVRSAWTLAALSLVGLATAIAAPLITHRHVGHGVGGASLGALLVAVCILAADWWARKRQRSAR